MADYVSLTAQRQLHVTIPPIRVQRKIGSTLGALDDKIELNRRMNETLEAMARALFKSWFIDFDPVRTKAAGRAPAGLNPAVAAIFPDTFRASPLGPIPIGWDVERLNCLMTFQGGTQPPANEFLDAPAEGYIRLVQIRDFYTDSHLTYVPDTSKLRKFTTDDILLARYGSSGNAKNASDSLGRVCRGLSGAYNVALVKVIAHKPVPEFLYWYLKSDAFQQTIKGMGARSVQSGFRKEDLDVISIVTAPDVVHKRFETFATHLWQHVFQNNRHSLSLSRARDALLRTLLAGELVLT